MEAYPRSTTWPYLLLALVLFGLAVSAPSRWFDGADWSLLARRDPWEREVPARRSMHFAALKNTKPAGPAEAQVGRPTTQLVPTARVAVQPAPEYAAPRSLDRTAVFPQDRGPLELSQAVPAEDGPDGDLNRTSDGGDRGALNASPSSTLLSEANDASRGDETATLSSPTDPTITPPPAIESDLSSSDLQQIENALSGDGGDERASQVVGESVANLAPGDWPTCVVLRQQVDSLEPKSAQMASWRSDILRELDALAALPALDDSRALPVLNRLEHLATVADKLEPYAEPTQVVPLRRVAYGLQRRVAVWRAAVQLAQQQAAFDHRVDVSAAMPIFQAIHEWLESQTHGASWQSYLMIDRLRQIASETWVTNPEVRRTAAREVLERMESRELTADQLEFLNQSAIEPLRQELRRWAIEPVDLPLLMFTLEQFEEVRSASLAEQIRQQVRSLGYSPHPAASPFISTIESHYRNANVRLVLSGRLLNDLLPVLEPIEQEIQETVLGAKVQGRNQTWTDLQLRLVEDNQRLHLRLEAAGRTHSRTVSMKGPVRLFTRDQSTFQADKELLVSPSGIHLAPAASTASGQSDLVDLKTDYDDVPILGWILRHFARGEHDEQRLKVRAHVDQRINQQARTQLDETVQTRLATVEDRFEQTILQPLRKMNLDPRAIEMKTTPDQLVLRCRLAGPDQLAAYTPRPRALSESVLSLQIHQSAPNNLIQQLKLENQRIELEELMRRMSEKLHLERQDIHEEIPEGVVLRLGGERPIEFEFDEDRVLITVRITELKTPRRTWRNFIVRGKYLPCISQTFIDLQREGGIELISEQLGFRDQVALRGIFTKVMSRNHRLNLLRGRFEKDARLANLGVTQFEARDGWIGISVGPQRRPRVATEASPVTR